MFSCVSSLNKDKPITDIWRIAKGFTNKNQQQAALISNKMIETILNILTPDLVHQEITITRHSAQSTGKINSLFLMLELTRALKTSINTSPGFDRIT